jgi:GNAT superfamily N-acetyltransferase
MKAKERSALTLVAATEREIDETYAMYRACTEAMLARGILQWDERYPTRGTAAEAVAREDLYFLVDAEDVKVGSVILNAIPAPEYAPIVWQDPEPALIVHTLVIDPRHQGGRGRAAMEACEEFARHRGFLTIRLDAFPGNPSAIALYERMGYQPRGHVSFGNKPPGHESYAIYEKRL